MRKIMGSIGEIPPWLERPPSSCIMGPAFVPIDTYSLYKLVSGRDYYLMEKLGEQDAKRFDKPYFRLAYKDEMDDFDITGFDPKIKEALSIRYLESFEKGSTEAASEIRTFLDIEKVKKELGGN